MDILSKISIRITAISMAVILLVVAFWLSFIMRGPNLTDEVEIVIADGYGVSQIATILKDEGVIKSRNIFIVWARFAGKDSRLKAGRYKFSGRVSINYVLNKISYGKSESEDKLLIIPEGLNIWEVEEKIKSAGINVGTGEFVRKFKDREGYLFPDTYRFLPENVNLDKVAQMMRDNYYKKVVKDPGKEIIVIASIIEKEAKTKEDMELVSGIIRKRMQIGMNLQIDATVAYGKCLRQAQKSNFDIPCDVTQVNLIQAIGEDGPYNSYMWPNLPPGPISNPGLNAINAALNPKESDYLFYLSTRDGSRMIYSKTAEEHNINRKKYLGL